MVILFHYPWDYSCDYVREIARELSAYVPVVLHNPYYLYTLRNLLVSKSARRDWLRPFTDRRYTYIPSVGFLPFQHLPVVRRINEAVNAAVFRLAYLMRFGRRNPVFWYFSYEAAGYLPFMRRAALKVYDRPDHFASVVPAEDAIMKLQDTMLMAASDAVLVNSPYSRSYAARHAERVYRMPWGYNGRLFAGRRRPTPAPVIARIRHPRIGIVGHLDYRTDHRLLYEVAHRHPQWQFVLVGAEADYFPAQAQTLDYDVWRKRIRELRNVTAVGQVAKRDVPAYIAGLDVCLILYDPGQEANLGVNPMKLYEYMALCKPVVSTPLPAVMEYRPLVRIAGSAQAFGRAISEALRHPLSPAQVLESRRIARENSWKKRVREICDVLSIG